jgi:hypothetical protein
MDNKDKITSNFHKKSMIMARCVTLVMEPVERGHDMCRNKTESEFRRS